MKRGLSCYSTMAMPIGNDCVFPMHVSTPTNITALFLLNCLSQSAAIQLASLCAAETMAASTVLNWKDSLTTIASRLVLGSASHFGDGGW